MSKQDKPKQPSTRLIAQQLTYSSPIPPPQILEQYEKILPGAAERIMKMAETQSSHRQDLERQVIKSGVSDSRRGSLFGLLIGMSGFGVVVYVASLGYQELAGIIAVLDIGSLVSVFVYGSRQRRIERVDKEEQNLES